MDIPLKKITIAILLFCVVIIVVAWEDKSCTSKSYESKQDMFKICIKLIKN